MKHSQRMTEPPLKPWAILHIDGTVATAHCNCMAGLGEGCSHVGALLFALEAVVQMKKSTACTSVPCSWIQPSTSQNVQYLQGTDIDFTSAHTKRKNQHSGTSDATQRNQVPRPTSDEAAKFFKKLHESDVKSSILSTVPQYCDSFVPSLTTMNLPDSLDKLYNPDLEFSCLEDLEAKCSDLFDQINVTQEQVVFRNQLMKLHMLLLKNMPHVLIMFMISFNFSVLS